MSRNDRLISNALQSITLDAARILGIRIGGALADIARLATKHVLDLVIEDLRPMRWPKLLS